MAAARTDLNDDPDHVAFGVLQEGGLIPEAGLEALSGVLHRCATNPEVWSAVCILGCSKIQSVRAAAGLNST